MRIERAALDDQARTVNFVKADRVSENPAASPAGTGRSSSRNEDKAAGRPNVAEEPLADLLKTEYDISFQLSFTVHKETKSLVVKVIDPDTNKVIREIPPEELLDLAAKIQEMVGLLIDKKI